MAELKPCPFCGGEAKFFITGIHRAGDLMGWRFGIYCQKCNIKTPKTDYEVEVEFTDYGAVKTVTDERPAAIEKWNLRTHH